MEIKHCTVCGTPFHPIAVNQIFCSYRCRLEKRRERRRQKDKPEPMIAQAPTGKSHLDKLIDQADACGLSYGQYTAQLARGKTFEELKALHEKGRFND